MAISGCVSATSGLVALSFSGFLEVGAWQLSLSCLCWVVMKDGHSCTCVQLMRSAGLTVRRRMGTPRPSNFCPQSHFAGEKEGRWGADSPK